MRVSRLIYTTGLSIWIQKHRRETILHFIYSLRRFEDVSICFSLLKIFPQKLHWKISWIWLNFKLKKLYKNFKQTVDNGKCNSVFIQGYFQCEYSKTELHWSKSFRIIIFPSPHSNFIWGKNPIFMLQREHFLV